jgi:ADP-heptose:LPS heptosyltransferase
MRILLLQLKRIGDGILTAPAVTALRAAHPQAEIVAIVPASFAGLFGGLTGVDRVLAYKNGALNADIWASLLFGEWDACYDFTGTDRSALMAWLSRAKRSVGYAKFASESWRARSYTELCGASVRDLHTVDFHLALVQGAGSSAQGDWSKEPEAKSEGPRAKSTGMMLCIPKTLAPCSLPHTPSVLVHLGTAREEKFWPAERWAEVIEALAPCSLPQASGPKPQAPCAIVLTGTNAGMERPHLDKLRALLAVPVTDLTGQLSLVQLAGLIQLCDLAIGVDSMAMHLAALFEKPQVVLFGPTNPFHWRPRHGRAVVLHAGHDGPVTEFAPRSKGGPMELISTMQVLDAIHRALPTLSWPSPTKSK